MLAMTDECGVVGASIPGLAARAGVSVESCNAAIAKFLAPDPYSRTKAFEGRRIEEIDGGWRLLNHAKYRDIMSTEERREYHAKYYTEKTKPKLKNVENVESTNSTHTDKKTNSDSKAKADLKKKKRESDSVFSKPSIEIIKAEFKRLKSTDIEAERFFKCNEKHGWVIKGEPIADWKAAAKGWIDSPKPWKATVTDGNASAVNVAKVTDETAYRVEENGKVYEFPIDKPPPEGLHRLAWQQWKANPESYKKKL